MLPEAERMEKGLGERRTSFERKRVEESSSSSGDLESSSSGELARMVSVFSGSEGQIVISRGRVNIPDGLCLRPEEILSLETLSERL